MKGAVTMFQNKIDVAKGFQTSVNIAYDLYNSEKVANFIPTLSSLDIFEDVLLSTAPNATDRARILIGAYGRGKSHIILVLLSLLFKKDKAQFVALLEKMKTANPKLYEYTEEYLNSDRKLLPIVVSGSSSSLTQSFLYALQQALNDENLSRIMPETHFKASISAIENWKEEYPETYKKFLSALDEPIDDFILSLKEYSVGAYEKFIKLYPSLTSGSSFNPFLGFDVVELYEKVVDKLSEIGYDGVYIVYDEFSKYLESSIGNATISDIKLLQDFAEKCTRSGKKQMHLMLICHKDIANYIDNNLPKEKVDGWRGVSGRFIHTTLHNNFSQMYEIISAVIKKEPSFWNEFVSANKARFAELEKRYLTNGLIDGKNDNGVKAAIYGCYPLHPISTFILPRLSEKIAQNERTLFTFLSSQEKHTLSAFLENAEGDFPMLTPDYVYDYFEPLFRKEVYTSDIHKIYKLTTNVLQKVDSETICAKIIKTISLIYMIEQFEKLPPIYDVIVDAFRETVSDTKAISDALEDLINKDCIVYLKRSNNYLKLKESSGVDIPQEIAKRVALDSSVIGVKDILNDSSFDSFMYPTRYNDEHEITRYFDFLFIDSDEFWATKDWTLKIENTAADGVVFAVIPGSEDDLDKLSHTVGSLVAGERIVFCLPKKYTDIKKIAFEYHAVRELKSLASEDDLLRDEYDIYIEDLEEVIGAFINSYARPENDCAAYYHNGKKMPIFRKAQMSALLSDICEKIYPHAPTINNESINKNILPTVAINSRTKLIAALLNTEFEANLGLVGTGQEVSFMRSTLIKTGLITDLATAPTIVEEPEDANIRYVLNTIQEFVSDAGINGEQSFSDLYERLTKAEYGIGLKLGVIPIYIALVLHQYRNNIVIKHGDSEQRLSADLLTAVNDNPSRYSIVMENWSEEKTMYMSRLEQIFERYVREPEKAYNSFAYIVFAMNRWYMSLPKYAKEMTRSYAGSGAFKSVLGSHKKYVASLKQLDINPREYLFEKLQGIFGYKEFSPDVAENVANTKKEYDHAVDSLTKILVDDVKTVFAPKGKNSAGTLTSAVKDWYSSLKETTTQHLFSNSESQTLELIKTVSNDEVAFVQRLGKAITSLRIEDWNESTIATFIKDLTVFKKTVDEYDSRAVSDRSGTDTYKLVMTNSDGSEVVKTFSRSEYSDRAKLLYNEITNSLDEMGQAITEQEKRQVLIEILEKLC